jgi:hypothetical protein
MARPFASARDCRLGGAIGGDHPRGVATIQHGRCRRLPHDEDRSSRLPEIRVVNDIQKFGQAGILVAAKGCVQHMVGQDACVVVVIASATHRCLAKRSRCGDRHSDAVVAGCVGHLAILDR